MVYIFNNYDGIDKGCHNCSNKNTDKCYTRLTGECPDTCPDYAFSIPQSAKNDK